jgi:hypothetical protein
MPQVSSRTCCAAAFFMKMGGIGRGVKQPQVEIENSTYACFYWISATIGRSQSDAMRVKNAVVHRTINLAQLCVRCDHVISNCPNRHNFATGHFGVFADAAPYNYGDAAKGQKTGPESKPVRRLPKS